MKLVPIKKSEYENGRHSLSKYKLLSINKTGVLSFGKGVITYFKLAMPCFVSFLKDSDEDPTEWYVRFSKTETEDSFSLRVGSGRMQVTCKLLAREIVKGLLKKKHPNTPDSELNYNVFVRFKVAEKPIIIDDQEVPDTYALLGGTVVE